MFTRRKFLMSLAAGTASAVVGRSAFAMQVTQNFAGPMQQDAYLPVNLAAKPNAAPSMTDQSRDDLEHRIKCQCGCVLDVFTCRTTDFSCSVSPAMHQDVKRLVAGGYNGVEILAAFQSVYGERVLMAPVKKGFNLVGYIMPFAALLTGGTVVALLIRKWGSQGSSVAAAGHPAIDATPAELEALDAELKRDA